MGFRTVVVLSNDNAHEWKNDPTLGQKIMEAASRFRHENSVGNYGSVIEVEHADVQTLAILDSTHGKAAAHTHWSPNQTDDSRDLALLKAFADKLGYRISKKT